VSADSSSSLKKEAAIVDLSSLDDADRKRHRRKLRMEYIRNKRSRIADGSHVPVKRQRLDPVFTNFNFSPVVLKVEPSPVAAVVETDLNKIRQLKNRESAERSRLKKDHLIDSLTCQVCECYVQLSDLMTENKWLLEVKHAVENGLPIPLRDISDSSSCYTTSSSASVSSMSVTSSGASSPVIVPCISSDSCTSSGFGYPSYCHPQDACVDAASFSSTNSMTYSSSSSSGETSSLSSCGSGGDEDFLFRSCGVEGGVGGWDEFDSVIEDFDLWFQEASTEGLAQQHLSLTSGIAASVPSLCCF